MPEDGATAYGSGTLVDVRDQFGLVVTNWHVVRDSQGTVEVVFPDGFRSHARPLKVDSDWDLAALVIWRPPIEPVNVADAAAAAGRPAHDPRLRPGPVPHRHRPLHRVLRAASSTSRTRWSSSTSKPGRATRAARSSTSAANWPACCSGQGRGPRSAASPRACESFLATLAPDIGQANATDASRRRRSPGAERAPCRSTQIHAMHGDRLAEFAEAARQWTRRTLAQARLGIATGAHNRATRADQSADRSTVASPGSDRGQQRLVSNGVEDRLWPSIGLAAVALQLMRLVEVAARSPSVTRQTSPADRE